MHVVLLTEYGIFYDIIVDVIYFLTIILIADIKFAIPAISKTIEGVLVSPIS